MICYVCLDLPWEMSMKVMENICLQETSNCFDLHYAEKYV